MSALYDIRFCRKNELYRLQDFIDKHWRKGHVLSQSMELFEFQHDFSKESDYYSFVIADNKESHEIDAVLGMINYYKYDPTHSIPNVGWTAIWKIRDDIRNNEIGFLGLKLVKYVLRYGNIDYYATLGISMQNKELATALHFEMGEMNRYYIPNSDSISYKIIVNPLKPTVKESNLIIRVLNSLDEIQIIKNDLNPYKNITYFVNRYQKHPFFSYIFWGVYDNSELKAVIVLRKFYANNASCLRIIDMIGSLDGSKSIGMEVQRMLKQDKAEYMDCLNHGIDPGVFKGLGFNVVGSTDDTILPEHFAPFEQKHVPLEFTYISDDPIIIFKGDGDQDRPNSVSDLCQKN